MVLLIIVICFEVPIYTKLILLALQKFPGNYGNLIDGASKPKMRKTRRNEGDEESELMHHDEGEEEGDDEDLIPVSSTPLMKPMITERFGRP